MHRLLNNKLVLQQQVIEQERHCTVSNKPTEVTYAAQLCCKQPFEKPHKRRNTYNCPEIIFYLNKLYMCIQ